MHVEAEFVHDSNQRMLRVNVPQSGTAPRFFLGQTPSGVIRRYRYDVDDVVRDQLEAASASARIGEFKLDAPLDLAPFVEILARSAPIEYASVGLAFSWPTAFEAGHDTRVLQTALDAEVLRPLLPDWIPDVRDSQPFVARLVGEAAVAACCSVRITREAHEAGVETVPEYRGQRHAAAVVATWASLVRERGLNPIYSTLWQNTASQAVARKLGLTLIGRDLHVT